MADIYSLPASSVASDESGGMSDQELLAYLQAHEAQAVGYYTSEIATEQAQAIDYYYGRPFGDEQPGRSQVVDRTVAIVVDNAVAAVMRPFVSADDAVAFEPVGPEDEQMAEQATEYVNYVFYKDNRGFLILHNWFKAAFLEKLGIVKTWWEDTKASTVERMDGLDAQQVEFIMQNQGEEMQVIGGPYTDDDGFFAIDVRRLINDGKVKIITVPSEEFLISPYARDIETAEYVAHRPKNVTRSDLIEMGFDPEVIDSLPATASAHYWEPRAVARLQDESFASVRGNLSQGASNDKSRDIMPLLDEYTLCDYDGDGIAERRRILRVGHDILLNEEVPDNPFAILCPVPMSHKVYGLSLADQTMDLQRIGSVLWRQTLDNLYISNNPKFELPITAERPDGSTIDDLNDPAVGGAIRTQAAGQLTPFAIPFVADKAFSMLSFIEAQQEARTGISRQGQGMDPDALDTSGQKTAAQVAVETDGRNARAEMIARIFAETGVSRLFRLILRLVTNHQPRERMIRLRNQWISMDPRSWNAEMDVSINVGLGVGSKMEQAAQADSIASTMAEVIQSQFGYLIGPDEVYHAFKRKLNSVGVKDVENYMKDPQQTQPPPPQPSPEMAKVEADKAANDNKIALEAQKSSAQLQQAQAESALKLQLMREEAAAKLQLERDKAAAEQELAIRQQDFEMEMARQQMELQREQMEAKAALDEKVAVKKLRPGGELDE